MQENNSFATIIKNWRRMSGEEVESVHESISGDSSELQGHKRKDDESTLLMTEKIKGPIATVAGAGAVSVIDEAPSKLPATDLEEKLLNLDIEETMEAAGDATNKIETDQLENDVGNKVLENELEKTSDNVDSVYLTSSAAIKPPPPQSVTSNPDDDECIIKCLYYTIQCCDCVLM